MTADAATIATFATTTAFDTTTELIEFKVFAPVFHLLQANTNMYDKHHVKNKS
jgi:hypothetical protein